MKRLTTLFLLGIGMFAQNPEPPKPANITRIVRLKHLTPENSWVLNLMVPLQVIPSAMPQASALVLTGPQERVDQAEALLRELDQPTTSRQPAPSKPIDGSVQLIFHVLYAIPGSTEPARIPPQLKTLAQTATEVFDLQNVRPGEVLYVRTSTEQGTLQRGFLRSPAPWNSYYDLALGKARATRGPAGVQFSLQDLNLVVNFPYKQGERNEVANSRIATSVTLREGEKVILGRMLMGPEGGSLILALEAKAIE